MAIQQNFTGKVADMYTAEYSPQGDILGVIAFVIYPYVPEAWGFVQ